MIWKSLFVFCLAMVGPWSLAHEGHHGPAVKMAPNGGVMRETQDLFLEMVKSDGQFKVFPFDHDMKPVSLSEIEVRPQSSIKNAKRKPMDLSLEPKTNHYLVQFPKDGSHRYELKLVFAHKGKEQKIVTWQLEP